MQGGWGDGKRGGLNVTWETGKVVLIDCKCLQFFKMADLGGEGGDPIAV